MGSGVPDDLPRRPRRRRPPRLVLILLWGLALFLLARSAWAAFRTLEAVGSDDSCEETEL